MKCFTGSYFVFQLLLVTLTGYFILSEICFSWRFAFHTVTFVVTGFFKSLYFVVYKYLSKIQIVFTSWTDTHFCRWSMLSWLR